MVNVSVIVPVYNVEKYLRQCLDSLVNQTLADIEIICINDGSTDGSLSILEEYASKDERIKVISQENQGQGVARNKGIELSSGEYIGFVDPDDWVEYGMFENLYKAAKVHNADLAEAMYSEYYEYSGMTKIRKSPVKLPQDKTFDWKINKDYLFKSSILAVWNKIYKRNFIDRHNIKFSNAKLAEDHMFTFKSKILAGKILFIDKPFYNYRVRRDSAVNSVSAEALRVVDILREVTGFFGVHGVCDITGRKNVDFYLEYTLARVFSTVPENLKKVYDKKCKTFLNDLQYMEYKKLKFGKYTPLERIFSLKNETSFGIRYKVMVLLGCKLRFRPLQKEIG